MGLGDEFANSARRTADAPVIKAVLFMLEF
jgi:hypothetical protein